MLVLSLFPGIGLLDMAFEAEGFCVVRGPDLLWGGDIRRFHPPAGKFDGVIGGPPCQAFSPLRHLVEHNGHVVAENLIPEFERCVREAEPQWFLMENVPAAPAPIMPGYWITRHDVVDVHVGGETTRKRAFHFGQVAVPSAHRRGLAIEWAALCRSDPEPAALASGGGSSPATLRHGAIRKAQRRGGDPRSIGYKGRVQLADHVRLQGLPMDFELPGFTVKGAISAIGNGVPLAMGRAIARAVKLALA